MSPDMAVSLVARYESEGKPREGVADVLTARHMSYPIPLLIVGPVPL